MKLIKGINKLSNIEKYQCVLTNDDKNIFLFVNEHRIVEVYDNLFL